MRRFIVAALTALLLGMAIPLAGVGAAAQEASIVSGVNFRTSPSTSAPVIRMLKKGETVALIRQANAYWLYVQDVYGTLGYISSDEKYVRPKSQGSAAPAASANATAVASVSFRTGPSTDAARIRYLSKGEAVTVTSQVNKYWYAVTDAGGKSGYVSTDTAYIRLTGPIGGPSQPSQPSQPGPSASAKIEAVIAAGMKYLGTPYEYGSSRSNTSTFDCSDLLRQMFKDALGTTLPADSRGQGDYVRDRGSVKTDWRSLKRGDLMFFMDYKGTKASSYSGKSPFGSRISHAAIYLGDGKVLHTYSKESGGVRVDSIAGKHWEYRFLYGGSAL